MDLWHSVFDIVILLAAALLVGGLLSRVGQSPLVGYLLVGMLLGGPGSLNIVDPSHGLDIIAELGVSLLLFSLGLEFSWRRLLSFGTRTLTSGAIQVAATLAVTAAVTLLFGLSLTESLIVGAMVALSSTAVVLRVLFELGELDSARGRNAIAILLVQDIAVVPLAVLVTVLTVGGSPLEMAAQVGRVALMAVVLVVSLYLILNVAAARVIGRLTLERNRELAILLAVVTGVGSAYAAHEAGISPPLGAFLAGMLFAGSPFATQTRADVSSFRAVLLTLFFTAAGMVADPLWILRHAPLVLAVVGLIIVGKTLVVTAILRAMKFPLATSIAAGLTLAQIGEFAFVLGKIASEGETLGEETYKLMVSAAIVALFISPFVIPAAPRFGGWVVGRLGWGHGPPGGKSGEVPEADVVIVGFGPAGRLSAAALTPRSSRVLVIDLNEESKRRAEEFGFAGMIGDATHMEVLEHAHVSTARVVLITIPNRSTAMMVLQHVRRLSPDAFIAVRSRYELNTHDFAEAGAHLVVGDEEEVGKVLARRVAELVEMTEPG